MRWIRQAAKSAIRRCDTFVNLRTGAEFQGMYGEETNDIQYYTDEAVQPGDTIRNTSSRKQYMVGEVRNGAEAWHASIKPFHLTGTIYRFTSTERDIFGQALSDPEAIATEIPLHFKEGGTEALTSSASIELLHGDLISVSKIGEDFLVKASDKNYSPGLQRLLVTKQRAIQLA